ncbi:MAG TPA: hypothetical protein VFI03_05125, partial [Solirubrobacterales bacterium]|nr:hypothetical protein [Solirubrobacterales bacterium]
MRGHRRRNRGAVLLAVVASASAVAAGCALLIVDEARVKSIPGLAIAVFGTFLTSMAIIAAFSIQEGSRWPTPWEALDRAQVPAWFVVALGSVVTALLAGAIDSAFLSAFSLTLALVAVPLGARGLWGLISLSSDQGRWQLVVNLLARSILEAGSGSRPSSPDLGEIETDDHVPASFLTAGAPARPQGTGIAIELVPGVLREYADRRDLEAIVRLISEVHAGARQAFDAGPATDFDGYLNSVDTVLHTQRQMYAELAERVLSGRLSEATARIALVRAGEAVLDTSGHALALCGESGEANRRRAETTIARHLIALCRLAGAVAREASLQLQRPLSTENGTARSSAEATRATALRTSCTDLQQAVRWAVDNDPPGMKIPSDHVWRAGLSDPDSALTWLWSTAESQTGPFGVGLYASCEILTGVKFFESYWDGFDVFTTIERRLYGDGGGNQDRAVAEGREAVERAGGLPLISLELAAARLAATPLRAGGNPAFDGDLSKDDDRHVACNLFLAGGGYKPRDRDPIADLAWLLTDRLQGSLWTTVYGQLAELPDAVLLPPLRPLHRRPDAAALAICLRLCPLEEAVADDALAALRGFLAQLPEPLLEGTLALALTLTSAKEAGLPGGREERERSLIAAARLARRVTPGPLPAQAGGTAREPAPVRERALPASLAPFEVALERIERAEAGLEIDLLQCDRRWLEEWAELRAELDAALLAAALRGAAKVRRVVLFDLPRDADRRATRLQYRWTESVSAAVGCFARAD